MGSSPNGLPTWLSSLRPPFPAPIIHPQPFEKDPHGVEQNISDLVCGIAVENMLLDYFLEHSFFGKWTPGLLFGFLWFLLCEQTGARKPGRHWKTAFADPVLGNRRLESATPLRALVGKSTRSNPASIEPFNSEAASSDPWHSDGEIIVQGP